MLAEFIKRAQLVKFLILDVDGVLTDGKLFYSVNASYKAFSVYDGLAIKLLQQTGVGVGIITGCNSGIINQRARELNIEYLAHSTDHKLVPYLAWQKELGLADEQFAYVGDDLPDLPVMLKVGLPITVPNASSIMHQHSVYVTSARGGQGAVREVSELLMTAQGTYDATLKKYLS